MPAVPSPSLSGPSRRAQRHRSLGMDVWLAFRNHKGALAGAGVFAAIALAVAVGPLVHGVDPHYLDFLAKNRGPSLAHPMGTDNLGRDMLAQVLAGGRISLAVGVTRDADFARARHPGGRARRLLQAARRAARRARPASQRRVGASPEIRMSKLASHRHARTCSGHLVAPGETAVPPWMAGTSPAMTGKEMLALFVLVSGRLAIGGRDRRAGRAPRAGAGTCRWRPWRRRRARPRDGAGVARAHGESPPRAPGGTRLPRGGCGIRDRR